MGEMGSARPQEELGLDLKLCAARAADGFLKEDPVIDAGGRDGRLEAALKGLEEERSKIEAFKRELPISIRIVSDVIEIVKDKLKHWRSERDAVDRNVVEEFIRVDSKFEEEKNSEMDCGDKMNWMSSAQLWSDNHCNTDDKNNNKRNMQEEGENLSLESNNRIQGGAFVPFRAPSISKKEEKPSLLLPDLSLLSSGLKESHTIPLMADEHRYGNCSLSSKEVVRSPILSTAAIGHLSLQTQQQQQQLPRKMRRCWSPELHRRFVLALQQLGGAQVATPKQIRELMKVDGLTNDEVKSHLQKYRLHTRRAPNSSASSANRPVVMLGGLWVPQDHNTDSQQSASHSGSPQGPLQLAGSAIAVSVTAGDSFEDDGKSESYSWK